MVSLSHTCEERKGKNDLVFRLCEGKEKVVVRKS